MARKLIDGAAWRVKAEHPRRPGPLRLTNKDGVFLAKSGQTCAHVDQETLASLITNGYVEPVEPKKGRG